MIRPGSYTAACERWYWWLRARLHPSLENSQYAYVAALREALTKQQGRWLDVGAGHAWVPAFVTTPLLPVEGWITVGVDPDRAAIARHSALTHRVQGIGERLPFPDQSMSLVSANMVLEHVEHPETLMAEIHRVLRPGGICVLHTPNRYGYTTLAARLIPSRWLAPLAGALLGRRAEDVYLTHYRANTLRDIRKVATAAGLRVQELKGVLSSPHFIRVPPVLVMELCGLRLLANSKLAALRPCLIAVLRRED